MAETTLTGTTVAEVMAELAELEEPKTPGCTSPFAPIWITEMVRRQHDK